ncbi:MAG: GNAT family N-acetyltransferase [Candidatus Bathyarchaeota archaeon]|nr:GNAT family N-acetyltransferase [Candidatus Bathyarchaeota archaeon]
MEIKKATSAMLPQIKQIIDHSFPWYYRYFAWRSVSEPQAPVLTAQTNGETAGFAKLTAFKIRQNSYGCILWIAVHPKHRRRGVGENLAEAAAEWFRQQGAAAIFASTQQGNHAAQATLGKAGFVRVGFWGLWRLFGWGVFWFYVAIWFVPGEVVFLRLFG